MAYYELEQLARLAEDIRASQESLQVQMKPFVPRGMSAIVFDIALGNAALMPGNVAALQQEIEENGLSPECHLSVLRALREGAEMGSFEKWSMLPPEEQ